MHISNISLDVTLCHSVSLHVPCPPPSLGVVFVSVTDSTDLANDNDNLADIAKELGLLGHAHQQDVQGAVGVAEAPDFVLAQRMQESEHAAQLARDRELAEQLQMTDFSYRTPRYDNYLRNATKWSILDI